MFELQECTRLSDSTMWCDSDKSGDGKDENLTLKFLVADTADDGHSIPLSRVLMMIIWMTKAKMKYLTSKNVLGCWHCWWWSQECWWWSCGWPRQRWRGIPWVKYLSGKNFSAKLNTPLSLLAGFLALRIPQPQSVIFQILLHSPLGDKKTKCEQ